GLLGLAGLLGLQVVRPGQPVAATLQTAFTGSGLFAEPGDLLRQWLLLGSWAGPAGTPVGDWFLRRVADALVLAAVWWALRRLPVLLTRTTVPAMALGAVCATVLGLLVSQLAQMALTMSDAGMRWGLVYLSSGIGGGVPAALTFGLVAGVAAAMTLRVAGGRAGAAASGADGTDSGPAEPGPDITGSGGMGADAAGSGGTGSGPDLRPEASPKD
ncbi:hypothetical protein ABZ136_22700, partial [Streptomyces microflavus]